MKFSLNVYISIFYLNFTKLFITNFNVMDLITIIKQYIENIDNVKLFSRDSRYNEKL